MQIEPPNPGAPTSNGASLKHYQIRALLGEGGFGQVYEAWDGILSRPVALKRIKREVAGLLGAGGLAKEARMAASLRHPAFAKVYALEQDGDSQAIVMELVPGQTLRAALKSGPLATAQALDIVRQVAQAMQQAHASGLVHGDLKPSNLMLEPDGTVRILDFGLATSGDQQATTSLMQQDPQGTIAYMAPERLLGKPASAQSDVYALGVLLFELLAGVRPFAELNGLALAAAHMESSSEQWAYPAQMPPALVKLVQAMTARQVARRLATMAEVAARVAALDGAAPESAARPIQQRLSAAAPLIGSRARWSLAAFAVCGLLTLGAWKLAPRLPELAAVARPFSEAQELKNGMAALLLHDRPGSLSKAEASFNAILKRNPKNAAAVAGTAIAYAFRFQSDDRDIVWLRKADASAKQAYALNDQLAICHAANSFVQVNENAMARALLDSQKALALDKSNTFALMAQLTALIALRRFDEATRVVEAAMAAAPQERIFVDFQSQIFYKQKNYKAAEAVSRRSIALEPDSVYAYANLSAALYWQNRHDESLKVLQDGLQIRPSAFLYGNLGNALFVRGDYLGAAAAFEHAVAPDGGNPYHYLGWANLADTLLWLPGRADEARGAYEKARQLLAPRLASAPNSALLTSRMGLYSSRTGRRDDAEALVRKAIALAPQDASVRFRAGLAHELLGNREIALVEIAKAIDLNYPLNLVEAEPDLLALRRDPAFLKHTLSRR